MLAANLPPAVTGEEAWIRAENNRLGGLTLIGGKLRLTCLAEAQAVNPSTRAPTTGAMYISGYGM
jgi:hypothetical protein